MGVFGWYLVCDSGMIVWKVSFGVGRGGLVGFW